ncbi:hypothetical protein Q3G72_003863 [Acer saccharum]|nr:hypothetical protein Q3G72_003863 [Acer saccharum]
MPRSAREIGSATSKARGVGSRPFALRWNRRSSNSVRRRASAALMAGWLTLTRVAARVTLRSAISASNAASSAWAIMCPSAERLGAHPQGHSMHHDTANPIRQRLADERRLVERLYDAFNLQDPDLLDTAVTPDWQDIPLAPCQGPGPDGLKPIIHGFIAAFPDVKITIHDMVQTPGQVAVRAEITGTHMGELFGIPATGKRVAFRIHEFHALNGERITTTWHMEDWFGLFQQLGRFPALQA